MKIYKYPDESKWSEIIKRPALDSSDLTELVSNILNDIKNRGDIALVEYEEKFDKVSLKNLKVTDEEYVEAESLIDQNLKDAIDIAATNIETFHSSQFHESIKIETTPGVICWQKSVGIEKVGLYVPGGTAPLFSTVLMLGIPARIAGDRNTTRLKSSHIQKTRIPSSA